MTVFEVTTVTSEPSLVHNDKNNNNDDTGNNNDDENSKTYEDQDDHLKLLYDDDIVIERAKGFLQSQKRRSDRFTSDVESCNGSVTSRSISSRSISSHSGKQNNVLMDLTSMRNNETKDTSYVIWCKEKVITNKKNDLSRKQRFCCYSIFSLSSIIVIAILIPLWSFLPSRNTTTGGTTDNNNLNNPVFGNITSSTTDNTTVTTMNSESMNDTIILPDNNNNNNNNTTLNSSTLDDKNDTTIILHNIILSFPPNDISNVCNISDEGTNSTACQEVCKVRDCCNFPSNLKALSCLDDDNNNQLVCMMYHLYCNINNNNNDTAIITSEDEEEDLKGTTLTNSSTTPSQSDNNSTTAAAAAEVIWESIPSPPSNLNETCSINNTKTKKGLAECSRECETEAASCCLSFKNPDDGASVGCSNNGSNPTPPVCLSYAPCLTLSASHHIDEDITTRMEEIECSELTTVDGRERCRSACSHVLPCCFDINEDSDSGEEKACTAQDHCFQYQICNSLLETYFSSSATLQTQEIYDICHNDETSLLCKAVCNEAECCFNTVVQNENNNNATIYYNDEQQQCDVDCHHEKYKPCSAFYEMETNYYDVQEEDNNNGNTTNTTNYVV